MTILWIFLGAFVAFTILLALAGMQLQRRRRTVHRDAFPYIGGSVGESDADWDYGDGIGGGDGIDGGDGGD